MGIGFLKDRIGMSIRLGFYERKYRHRNGKATHALILLHDLRMQHHVAPFRAKQYMYSQ